MFASPAKESRIEATVMRREAPDPKDPRPWQMQQCPHCNRIFWSWQKGTISYWHRNPLRRLWHEITSTLRG
jgi:hypothetical protein